MISIVLGHRYPSQVRDPIVCSIPIDMVYEILAVNTEYECLGDETVNPMLFLFAVFTENYNRISM